MIQGVNLDWDNQADREAQGVPDKAVCAYANAMTQIPASLEAARNFIEMMEQEQKLCLK